MKNISISNINIEKAVKNNSESSALKINNFIQEMQLKIDSYYNIIFEWIPYNQFDNIKEIGKDGLFIIYSAIWNNSQLYYDIYKKKYKRANTSRLIHLISCLQVIRLA